MATLTCIPESDSDKLIQVVYLSQPVIGPRRGKDLAEQIKTELDEHGVVPSQIESDVYDGAFLHDHVPEYLDNIYGIKEEGEIFHAYDPMHKSALEDGHIGKQKGLEWTVEITSTVCDALKKFRTRKNHYVL